MSGAGRSPSGARGFTLVEMMASILVFALMTLGLVPLLLSSVRAANLSRSRTIAKNLAQQAMERVRGLPYYSPVNDPLDPRREDVLDLYYPNMGPGYSAGTFTTTCTATSSAPSPSADSACPPENNDGTPRVPEGYTVTFEAQFVSPVSGSDPQTFDVVVPSGYAWDAPATETPRSQLLRMTITTTWSVGGRPQRVRLASLLSGGDVSPDRLRGNGTLEYTLEVDSAYLDVLGRRSTLSARIGRSVSSVEERAFVVADQEIRTGVLTLRRDQSPAGPATTLATSEGASAILHAPPNLRPAPTTTSVEATVVHPDDVRRPDGTPLSQIAALDDTTVVGSGTGVEVVSELPFAEGEFDFSGAVGSDLLWVTNQSAGGSDSPLRLTDVPMVRVGHTSASRVSGESAATATAIVPAGSRMVETSAHAEFGYLSLLPTDFAPEGILRISDFRADATCRATGSSATATATGSWSATLSYFQDLRAGGGPAGYVGVPGFNGSETSVEEDPLVALRQANPIVYDAPGLEPDLHLFEKSGEPGYLASFTSLKRIDASSGATTASVTIPQAFAIETNVTDPANPESFLGIRAAQMSCEAVDRRG